VKRSTGVRAGWDHGTVKRRKSGVPTRLANAEGHTTEIVQNARSRSTPRGRRPQHERNLSAREPGDPSTAHARWKGGPHREGRRPYADDERPRGVGQARSTDEVAEQGRARRVAEANGVRRASDLTERFLAARRGVGSKVTGTTDQFGPSRGRASGSRSPEVPIERLSIFGSNSGIPDVDNSTRSLKADESWRPQGGSTPWHRVTVTGRP
jgi:hypothetical protein